MSATPHHPEKAIFKFSSHDLSDDEKTLLCKCLIQFLLNVWVMYIMLPFELLFRDINKNEMPNGDSKVIKNRLKDSAFFSFWSYNYN